MSQPNGLLGVPAAGSSSTSPEPRRSSDSAENLRRFRSHEMPSYSGTEHVMGSGTADDSSESDGLPSPPVVDRASAAAAAAAASSSDSSVDSSFRKSTSAVDDSFSTASSSAADPSTSDSVPLLTKRMNEHHHHSLSKTTTTTTTVSESIDLPQLTITKKTVTTSTTAQEISDKDKKQIRRPRFADLKFQPSTTILENEASKTSIFAGFYTLFWLGTFFVFLKTILINYHRNGYIMQTHIVHILWRDLPKIAFTDFVLFLLTFAHVGIQKAIANHVISWNGAGTWIVSIYELVFMGLALWWPMYCDYPWIGRVFLCLHSLVLLMKQHSYAFFCGHLSTVRDNLMLFESALRGLREEPEDGKLSESQLEQEQKLLDEITFCHVELRSEVGSCTKYPRNVSLCNFFDYMMMPTLVYELEYPRTEKIRWGYVFEKVAAIFGVFFLMILIAEQYFYPIVMHALSLRTLSFVDKAREYPFLLLELMMPFMLMYLLTWYMIWEAILNAIAELTRFADRRFYGPWWNCVQWDEFAREWNVPVHLFLLRHVYHSSISAFKVSKHAATFVTFFISSVIHELVMFVIFKKLRGYLLFLQMCQLPLVQLSKSKFLKDNKVFGSIMFWFGIYTGPSMMCVLYLTF